MWKLMLITYRRSGGLLTLLTFAAVTLAATVLTVTVAAGLFVVALGIAAVALLARAVLPSSWRHATVSPLAHWPHKTIEATLVTPAGSTDEGDLLRLDSDKG